jgi:Ras-related protein Rab-11A
VTDSESYANLVHWLEECERYADNVDNSVNKAVFANKCDISESDRTIDSKRGQEFAKQNNLTFFETSAKTGAGVDEAFTSFVTAITERVLQKFHRDDDDDAPKKKKKKNIKLGKDTKDKDKEKKKCGCN